MGGVVAGAELRGILETYLTKRLRAPAAAR
jgi:hypothetical protein